MGKSILMPVDYKASSITEAFGIAFSQSRFESADDSCSWFSPDYHFDELINSYWGIKVKSRPLAISKNINDDLWKGLVSEWDSFTPTPGQFRLSKNLIFNFLRLSLGKRKSDFELSKLTELELKIFEQFFVELEKYWKGQWRIADPNSSGTNDFLIWSIEFQNSELASLAISIPPGLRPKNYLDHSHYRVDIDYMINELDFKVPIDLCTGKSKLPLSDLKQLEEDDIVLLEKSSTDQLWWERNDYDNLYINIELPSRNDPNWENLYYDDLEVPDMPQENLPIDDNDLFTDLNIELTAQFKSINLPLKQIMELKDGGVLPLGLLLDSELYLIAAGNKIVAKGELIVVGNQFGLKIKNTKIKSEKIGGEVQELGQASRQAPAPQQQQMSPQQMQAAQAQQQAAAQQQMSPQQMQAMQAAQAQQQAASNEEQQLQQELEDVGLDPDELDELGELY